MITRPIRPRLKRQPVLVKMADYEKQQHELELLRRLVQGDADIAAGRLVDFDKVMAEAKAAVDRK